jgi:hypothetical protein
MSIPNRSERTIALDADGVMLDYGSAYAGAWERAFGVKPALRNPNAYWPMERWNVPHLSGAELEHFRSVFDEIFWSRIPAIDGALEGCQILVDAGYELICVTALEARNLKARERNLLDLGFPISRVVATRMEMSEISPKAQTINSQELVAFVDDFSPYFKGVNGSVHKALITRDPDGSPNNSSHVALVDSTHSSLLEFCRWWISI